MLVHHAPKVDDRMWERHLCDDVRILALVTLRKRQDKKINKIKIKYDKINKAKKIQKK